MRLGMIVMGVMAYLGDRVRRAPDGYAPQHRLIPLALASPSASFDAAVCGGA
jgi:hypothetical protein